jgi:hypothetical protein
VLESGNRCRANHFSAANTGSAQTFSIASRFVSFDTRAKSAGTNRQYIHDAEKIVEEHPELAAAIESA